MGAVQNPLPWQRPRPASDATLAKHLLPCDVQVGGTIFREGTPLLLLVKQHRALYAQRYGETEPFA